MFRILLSLGLAFSMSTAAYAESQAPISIESQQRNNRLMGAIEFVARNVAVTYGGWGFDLVITGVGTVAFSKTLAGIGSLGQRLGTYDAAGATRLARFAAFGSWVGWTIGKVGAFIFIVELLGNTINPKPARAATLADRFKTPEGFAELIGMPLERQFMIASGDEELTNTFLGIAKMIKRASRNSAPSDVSGH